MATAKPRNRGDGSTTQIADGTARVNLPKEFADCLVDVVQINEFEVRIRKVASIPEREAWLWKNPQAIGAVMIGLEEAKAGKFVEEPDLAAEQ